MKKLILATALLSAFSVQAEQKKVELSLDNLYVGGSFSNNVIDSPFGGGSVDAFGISAFAGYELDNDIEQVMTAVEAGYSQTEDFTRNNDINGLWVSAVAQKQLPEIDPRLSAMARIGIDFGDDDGIFMGAGAAFRIIEQVEVRAEYINKDATTVYQASGVFKF